MFLSAIIFTTLIYAAARKPFCFVSLATENTIPLFHSCIAGSDLNLPQSLCNITPNPEAPRGSVLGAMGVVQPMSVVSHLSVVSFKFRPIVSCQLNGYEQFFKTVHKN